MPYIIETGRVEALADSDADDFCVKTSVAVATLDDALSYCVSLRNEIGVDLVAHEEREGLGGIVLANDTLPMAFGPLPDGTIIEVRQVGWDHFGQFAQEQARPLEWEHLISAYNTEVNA